MYISIVYINIYKNNINNIKDEVITIIMEELIVLDDDTIDAEGKASQIGMECSIAVYRCLGWTVLPTAGIHSIILKNIEILYSIFLLFSYKIIGIQETSWWNLAAQILGNLLLHLSQTMLNCIGVLGKYLFNDVCNCNAVSCLGEYTTFVA